MAVDPQIRALARRVALLEKQALMRKQPTLGSSSIEGGALQAADDNGDLTMIVGTQFDGTNAPAVVVSPAPPKVSPPLLTSQQGALRIYWDGTWDGGNVAPMDFARVTAYAEPLSAYSGPEPTNQAIIVGTFQQATGGEITAALDPGIEYAVYLHAWNIAGKYGPSSDVATAIPGEVVLPEDLASKSAVYAQDTSPWPDGSTDHGDDISDIWINTSLAPGNLYRIITRRVTGGIATIKLDQESDITVGKLLAVDGIGDPWDGSFTVTSVNSNATEVSFALAVADLPETITLYGMAQGQDIKPGNKYNIWDGTRWVLVQDSDISAAATFDRDLKAVQDDVATTAVTATDAYHTAYAADGRVSISDYEPGPDDVAGKNDGSLWITRTRERRNLILNPSFEGAANTTGWETWSGATISSVLASPAGDGLKAMQIVNDSLANRHGVRTTQTFPMAEGMDFTASGYIQAKTGSFYPQGFETSTGGWLDNAAFGTYDTGPTPTISAEQVFAQTKALRAAWLAPTDPAKDQWVGNQFTGLVNGQSYTITMKVWISADTPTNSIRPNLLFDASGPYVNAREEWVDVNFTFTAFDVHAFVGFINENPAAGQLLFVDQVRVTSSTDTGGYRCDIEWYDATDGLLSTTAGQEMTLDTADWLRLYATGQAPAGSTYAKVVFTAPQYHLGSTWLLDAVMAEYSTTLGRYFDGDSEGGAWTGTPDLSPSTLDGNAIIRLFTLEDAAWTEKFWTADTIISVSASSIDRGEMDGLYLKDNSVAVDKAYMPKLAAAEALTAGDLVFVANVGGVAMVYKADANAARRCNGFVLDSVSTGQLVTVYTSGYNPLCSGLSVGVQFLSPTAGKSTNAAPITAGNIAQRVGYATDASTLVFSPGIAVTLS